MFAAAVRMDEALRDDWLDRVCGDDEGLRELLDRLLASDEQEFDRIEEAVRQAAYSTACRIQARAKRSSS